MQIKDTQSNRGIADIDTSKDIIQYSLDVMRGMSDPIWCLQYIFGVTLFPEQERQIRELYRDKYNPEMPPYKQLVYIAGMRSGKTAEASMIATYEFWCLCVMSDPAKHWGLLSRQEIFISVIAPSEKQALDGVFGNCLNLLSNSVWCKKWLDLDFRSNDVRCAKNNVTLMTLGSWASTAVGRTHKCVVFDEMDTFEDTSSKRGAEEVYTRLYKSTDTLKTDGKVVVITSPRHANSIGMNLYRDGLRNPRVLAVLKPTWEANPNLTEAELIVEHKYNMSTFYRDYACQPEMWSGVQFPEGVKFIKKLNILQEIDKFIPDRHMRVVAIDPALKNDSFGVASGYKEGNMVIIDGAFKFVKKEGKPYILPSDVSTYLYNALPKIGAFTLVHDTWMFPEILEQVNERFGITCIKHIVRKVDYDLWRDMQSEGTIEVVYDEFLEREATRLVITPTGNTNHPYGGSKDIADCVANVAWYLMTQNPLNDVLSNVVMYRAF